MLPPSSPLTHRSAPVGDHVRHDGRQGAARGQALEQEAQEVEPVRDERIGNVELLQHVRKGILEAVAGGARTQRATTNHIKACHAKTTSCGTTSRYASPGQVTSRKITSCGITSRHVTPSQIMSLRIKI